MIKCVDMTHDNYLIAKYPHILKVKVKVKVALLSITSHVKTYKEIDRTFPTLPR